ncbi:TIM barrel protein [Streptomyces sp. NPDC052415]|uniref:TIM barrel protein n=1 Tax=Streptomyces sp. NPDC052415 TaxID=3365690 RepID=UPI0037CE3F38
MASAPIFRAKLGITPTCWRNADFPDIGRDIAAADIIDGIKQCSATSPSGAEVRYRGTSLGPYFKEPELKRLRSEPHPLTITEPWVSTFFTEYGGAKKTLDEFDELLSLFQDNDLPLKRLGVAEFGNAVHLEPDTPLSERPRFSQRQWENLVTGLNDLGKQCRQHGIELCYHPHMGTGVQSQQDMDRLMAATNAESVKLLLDTGHLTWAGGDPVAAVRRHGRRIKHVHLKNVRPDIVETALGENYSFKQAVLAGVFTVPGDRGGVDFEGVVKELRRVGYDGKWLVVEAEQKLKDVQEGNAYAQKALGFLAGLGLGAES